MNYLNKIQNEELFHLGNKVNNAHIVNFKTYKMKVGLVSQLFSKSIAEASLFCQTDLKLTQFENATATIELAYIPRDQIPRMSSRGKKLIKKL